jgi:hypothetical protein
MSLQAEQAAGPSPKVSAMDYGRIPYIPRRDLWPGHAALGGVVVYAAKGGTGKGLLFAAVAARTVLGLPFPNEDQAIRREPRRVLWITGPGEDDLWEDMAPRLRAAIESAAAEFGLDPDKAAEAIALVYDLSWWADGTPLSLPEDCARLTGEVAALNADGGPTVALVVADSLSALLSDGCTVDSRQGARRVLGKLSRFARAANVALVLLHHTTKDGKVAGSAGLLDGVRLAFIIEKDADRPEFRTITQHKANADDDPPQQYVIAGSGPTLRARFTLGEDARNTRSRQAQSQPAPAATAGVDPRLARSSRAAMPPLAPPGSHAPEVGPFRVMRIMQQPGQAKAGAPQALGDPYATRDVARSVAANDAGQLLTWKPGDRPGIESAVFVRADGARVGYAVSAPKAF